MAASKGDPLPATSQQGAQKPTLLAKKAAPGPQWAPQAPPQKRTAAPVPPPAKPPAQAPKEAAAGSKSPISSKGKAVQSREPMVEEASVTDIIIPIPKGAKSPSRVSSMATTDLSTTEEDGKLLNYQRLSHFRHRRFYPRGAAPQGGASLWGPEANVPAKAKRQGGEEAPAGQPEDYIVENYIHSPDSPGEPEVTSMKMLCFGAVVTFIIVTVLAWAVVHFRHASGHTTPPEPYQAESVTSSKDDSSNLRRVFVSRRSTAVLLANATVREETSTTEDGDSSVDM